MCLAHSWILMFSCFRGFSELPFWVCLPHQMFPESTAFVTHSPPKWLKGRERAKSGNLSFTLRKVKHREIHGLHMIKSCLCVCLPQSCPRQEGFSSAGVVEESNSVWSAHTETFKQILISELLTSSYFERTGRRVLVFLRSGRPVIVSWQCHGTVALGTCSLYPLRCSRGACACYTIRRTCPDWRWSRDWPRMAAASCRTTARAQKGHVRWGTTTLWQSPRHFNNRNIFFNLDCATEF